ncbi:hypothetical protein MWU75_14540 [Ornithinimicrobium sp. F0845]|uniref:hypothetical protein n=1 Tax=Ornithinimicrobium sp. F0845 TaxID=2926412 RepID=UPI001FF66D4A|nr:hypothetical protein [Ornithinimicrobium sp. F0845]MCK0113365.1 hypothetical protein [Ornithinimicrobium sp. F0845]
MDRRSTTTAIIATSALVALLSGCSGDNDQPTPTSTGSVVPPDDSQATAPSTPGETASGDAASGSTSALPTVPTDYADHFVRAWGSDDQTTMARLATDEVVQSLDDRGGPHWDQTSAEGAAGSTIVTYTNTETGDTLALRLENELVGQGAGQAVVEAQYTTADDSQDALPTAPEDYADTLVVAWGEGDRAAMQRLATDEVVHTLGDRGSPHWERISTEGAAGSTIVTYTETQTGEVLTLRVDNAQADHCAEHSVVEARFEDD